MAHNSHSDDSSAITSEISVIVGDDESDLKPNFNSTAITNDDRPFTHRADWKSVNSSLRISPILHETRNALNINQRITNFENSNPMARRECEPSMIDTSHFTSHVDMSSSGERKFESGYETSVDCDGRRLQLIEEDKENELDGAREHPGTSTPVRESAETESEAEFIFNSVESAYEVDSEIK
ncbi:hypothetical protein Tcan_09547 [Toxocara canis]|uniref:Uncharacterized protein n=1 Tax=Toxocara canis TaxID=6265 RepID=A0A0B2VK26_TOXCA|nr:hypothetical protein Tcan_09547 [Toxocara canis]